MRTDLRTTLQAYEQILGHYFELTKQPIFLFVDEVQRDPQWSQALKVIHDRCPNLFIICSGSSATQLQLNADVAGRRALIEKLYPLSFGEYQLLKHGIDLPTSLAADLRQILYLAADAGAVYDGLRQIQPLVDRQWNRYDRNNLSDYLRLGSMTFTLSLDTNLSYRRLRDSANRLITDDVLPLGGNYSLTTIRKLLPLLAKSSQCWSLSKLTDALAVNRQHLVDVLENLALAEILLKVPAYGRALLPTRYLFMSPALRYIYAGVSDLIRSETEAGLLLEDLAGLHYNREFVGSNQGSLSQPYSHNQASVCDFILTITDEQNIALEFGHVRKNIKQVVATMQKINCKYGLVFSETPLKLDSQTQTINVPLDYFYLM